MVDGIFDSDGVLVGEEGDAGLGLGQVVDDPSVSDALTMGGDGPCRKV